MTFLLRILQAPGGVPEAGARRLDPGAGPLTIGRGSDSDWTLPDPERHISKVHCRIEPGADGLYLVDLSSNGVFFATEARPVGRGNRRALDAGDSFRIGDYRIGVTREAPGASPGPGDASAPVAVGISAILDGTSEGHEQRAARSLSAPASITATCMRLQAEMLEWSSGRGREKHRFDGTIRGLSRRYQVDEASPFRRLKHTTREKDVHVLRIIEKAFGDRALDALKLEDFWRWYNAAKKPKTPGGPERVRRAWGIMKKLREMVSYGVSAELAGCARVKAILTEVRFPQPARRRVTLDLAHVEAFISKATEMGRVSLALATALQFDTALRQKDVIGEWEPIPAGHAATGIVLNGHRWVGGLTWADVVLDGITRKVTSKTGAIAAHDLTLCPHVQTVAAQIPAERRVGPLIVDEKAGRPYAGDAFGREWRVVARAAGIPDAVWNMDARAGAITEAEDAGADLDDARAAAAHTQASTTARYSRGAVGKSRKVATLRIAHRGVKNGV